MTLGLSAERLAVMAKVYPTNRLPAGNGSSECGDAPDLSCAQGLGVIQGSGNASSKANDTQPAIPRHGWLFLSRLEANAAQTKPLNPCHSAKSKKSGYPNA